MTQRDNDANPSMVTAWSQHGHTAPSQQAHTARLEHSHTANNSVREHGVRGGRVVPREHGRVRGGLARSPGSMCSMWPPRRAQRTPVPLTPLTPRCIGACSRTTRWRCRARAVTSSRSSLAGRSRDLARPARLFARKHGCPVVLHRRRRRDGGSCSRWWCRQ